MQSTIGFQREQTGLYRVNVNGDWAATIYRDLGTWYLSGSYRGTYFGDTGASLAAMKCAASRKIADVDARESRWEITAQCETCGTGVMRCEVERGYLRAFNGRAECGDCRHERIRQSNRDRAGKMVVINTACLEQLARSRGDDTGVVRAVNEAGTLRFIPSVTPEVFWSTPLPALPATCESVQQDAPRRYHTMTSSCGDYDVATHDTLADALAHVAMYADTARESVRYAHKMGHTDYAPIIRHDTPGLATLDNGDYHGERYVTSCAGRDCGLCAEYARVRVTPLPDPGAPTADVLRGIATDAQKLSRRLTVAANNAAREGFDTSDKLARIVRLRQSGYELDAAILGILAVCMAMENTPC